MTVEVRTSRDLYVFSQNPYHPNRKYGQKWYAFVDGEEENGLVASGNTIDDCLEQIREHENEGQGNE